MRWTAAIMILTTSGLPSLGLAQPADPSTPTPAPAPVPAKPEVRKQATWIRLDGLDTSAASVAIIEAFKAARDHETPVVIEIGSMPAWRADVLRDTLLEIKGAKSPVHVHVTDIGSAGKPGVSRAAALLGLAATSWTCMPSVLAEGELLKLADEGKSRDYLVDKTNWTLVEGDLRDLAAWAWDRRGGQADRVDLLAFPKQRWWAVEPKKPKESWAVSSGEKPKAEPGMKVHDLCEADAMLPLAAIVPEAARPAKAATVPAAAKAAGLSVGKDADTRGPSNLNALFVQVASRLESARTSLDAAEKRLKTAEDADRKSAKAEIERVKKDLAAVDKFVAEIEERLGATPELTRMVPPGKADVASKPSSQPARWRSAVQSLKDKSAKAAAKVGELAK